MTIFGEFGAMHEGINHVNREVNDGGQSESFAARGETYDDGGTSLTPATTSALDHVPRQAEIPELHDEVQEAADETAFVKPEETHEVLDSDEFFERVKNVGGGVVRNHATMVHREIIRATANQHPDIEALPPSERPAYYVQTRQKPEGEWVVSIPNAQAHADIIYKTQRSRGEKTTDVLTHVLGTKYKETVVEAEAAEAADKRAAATPSVYSRDTRVYVRGTGSAEFIKTLPTIAEVKKTHGPVISRDEFAQLASTDTDQVKRDLAGRVFNNLSSVLYRNGDEMSRVIPIATLQSSVNNIERTYGNKSRIFVIASRILERAQAQAATQQTPPDAPATNT